MNANAKKVLAVFQEILGVNGSEAELVEIIRNFVKGTPAEQAAAATVAQAYAGVLERAKAGGVSVNELKRASLEVGHALTALAEAKALRVKKKALAVFINAITLYLVRLF